MARGQVDALEKTMEVGAGKCSRPIGGSNWISILNLPAFRPDGPITRYVKIISSVLTQKLVERGKRTTSPKKSILPASLSLVFPKPPKANHFQLSLQDWLLVACMTLSSQPKKSVNMTIRSFVGSQNSQDGR